MRLVEAQNSRDLNRFIEFPYRLYARDPLYVPQLRREMRDLFSPRKNPFFAHAEVGYFLAEDGGEVVGRIAAILNRRHIETHGEQTGFFGFYESVDDRDVCGLLLGAAGDFLGTRGMRALRGPMNFSTNEECGFLLEGYDSPPVLMMPYNPPYYHALMESAGMAKAKDLYAYLHFVQEALPEKALRVAAIAERRGVRVRPVDKGRFRDEMKVFKEIYNAAWEKNWGFIPLTDAEIDYMGERLKQIAVPELTLIAEDGGRPVGFLGLIPDFNVVLRKMGGRLNPLTIAKALYYSRKIPTLRLLLLGIRPEYRNRGVDALLYREGFRGIKKGGYAQLEFSWILEDNIAVQRIVELVGGTLYKKYRIYEKPIP